MINRRLILFAPDEPAKVGGSPPAPAPAASPAPPSAAGSGASENPFAEIDAKFAAGGTAPSDIKPPKPDSGEPAAPAASVQPSSKPAEKAPEKPAGEVQRTPKELRAELERTKTDFEAHKKATAALEAKIADYEKKGKDTDALRARLDARDKEFEQLQGQLRALKQESSPEFKQQYDVPFDRAARFAESMIKGMTKLDGTPATFEGDFIPLYRMPYNAANALAKELFGDDAPAIMQQVGKLQELDFARREAFEEEKKGWAEKQKAEEGRIVQQREQFRDAWQKINTDLQSSVPGYKDPVDDAEAAELRNKGHQIFDAETKTPRELLLKNAHIRQRSGAYGPNQLQIKRLTDKLASAEAELVKLKPRQPNPDPAKPGSPEAAAPQEDWEDGLRKAVGA